MLAARKEEERKNPPSVAFAYGKDGAGIKSADGKFQFRFRPLLQADGRFYISEGTNTFLLRRVRPVLEGTVFEFFDWRIMPELAGTPNVQDAYGNIRFIRELQFRGGKFKSPVGLERLASDGDLPFVERGLPTQLVPDRDVGIQLHGDLLDNTVTYAVGYFNGVADGVNGDLDNNDKKDLGRQSRRSPVPAHVHRATARARSRDRRNARNARRPDARLPDLGPGDVLPVYRWGRGRRHASSIGAPSFLLLRTARTFRRIHGVVADVRGPER